MPDQRPPSATAEPTRDKADEAMTARARERFAREHRRARRGANLATRQGTLPNLIVIGGLKCGTTSLHHYLNLHPNISMSRPKELNFFVEELNWPLGRAWYASHFPPQVAVRGESSPHYTNLPRFQGVAERMHSLVADARLIYLVRDPIDRMLSHYVHNVGGGYERRSLEQALGDEHSSYVARSRYATQLEPYVDAYREDRIEIVTREELKENRAQTMRRIFSFLGLPDYSSEQFEREWETGTAKERGRFRVMDRAVRLPGLRALDRSFDRLPESLRWVVERLVHQPDAGDAPKPDIPTQLRDRLTELFQPEVERLEQVARRRFGWLA